MKTWNRIYQDQSDLESFIENNGIHQQNNLLVQIFTGISDVDYIKDLLKQMHTLLPNAVFIGATTDGEIEAATIHRQSTLLSFSAFEKTTLETAEVCYASYIDSFQAGAELARKLTNDNTKAMIVFSDGLYTNGEELLRGIESVNPTVVVAGGLAGDNVSFTQTFVFAGNQVLSRGVVGVALNNKDLIVNNSFHFDWTNIGRQMTVTKAKGNRIYEIDHMPAIEIYKRYLGEEVANRLPEISGLFPLVLDRKGNSVARTVIGAKRDGSLVFAGNVHEGDQIQFAYGNAEMILESSTRMTKKLAGLPIESIFIYTCSARRRFMPDIERKEIEPFHHIAPTAGFFTYGEFYHFPNSNELLSQTMTILLMSENPDATSHGNVPVAISYDNMTELAYLKALANLINVTAKELQATNQALLENEERYRLLIESCPETIAVHCDGKFVYGNMAAAKLVGAKNPEELYGRSFEELIHPDYMEIARERVRKSVDEQQQSALIEQKLVRLDGKVIDVEVVTLPFTYHNRPATQAFVRDITEQKKAEERIRRQAYYDSLTGLPNRRMFHKRLSSALKQARKNQQLLAVLFLDLDRFKYINDTLGHTVGDSLLRNAGKRLATCIRETDMVARLGGDEFTILLPNLREEQSAIDVAERIIEELAQPFNLHGYEFFLTTSIGISFYPDDGDKFETLIRHADTAMYYAKEQGRNNYQVYDPDMNSEALKRLVIENYLRKALQNGELSLYYQPVVEVESRQIIGMEALLRWDNPELGRVDPAEYIPIAEETGLIVQIGEWVLRTACSQNKTWQDAGLPPLHIAVNLSARQFLQGNIVETVSSILLETGLAPEWLDLEMTETIMQNSDTAIQLLCELRDMGVQISLDDFGTGYSSLSYLKRMPIHTLKIDQSFVKDISTDSDNTAIAAAIIAMAHTLKLKVIAEGVETGEQLACLQGMRCDQMQGYLFSRPLPPREFENILREWAFRPANNIEW